MTELAHTAPVTDPALVSGTVPYAWPWDGALAGSRLALLLAGSDAAWRHAAPLGDAAARRLVLVVTAVRAAGGIVVPISHPTPRPRAAMPPGANGRSTEENPLEVTTAPADVRDRAITAAGLDGFYGSPLDAVLRAEGRDQLVLAGWGLEGPVHSTMRTANDQGYECLLLSDAVGAITPGTRDPALSIVTMSGGIFGALGSSDALCAALASLSETA